MAESPVVTPTARNVAITVFGDTEETEEDTMAAVDNTLQISLISKAMVDRLRVSYKCEPSQHEPITDSTGRTHRPISQTKLRWHKSGKAKSHPHVFHIVDGLTPSVVLGATAVPSTRENDVGTLGLSKKTDDEKKRQEQKKKDEEAKREKEKQLQADHEKQKRVQNS